MTGRAVLIPMSVMLVSMEGGPASRLLLLYRPAPGPQQEEYFLLGTELHECKLILDHF